MTGLGMTFALECQVRFLSEEQTKPYLNTVREHLQEKIAHGAKSTQTKQALLG